VRAGERLKGRLKRTVRRLAAGPPANAADRSVILSYHSVGQRDHEMNVTPAAFAGHMRWLVDHCAAIPLAAAASGAPGVAVTFDDGYRDNLTEAASVLDALRISATVFIVAGRAGAHLDHDDPRDESSRLLSWDEVRELFRVGWNVGAHTMTHCRLSRFDEDVQRREITECRSVIECETGRAPEGFAYPFGSTLDYTPSTQRLVREAGFDFAVSNRYGVNRAPSDRFALRRIWIDRTDTLASFSAKVDGRLDRLSWLDSPAGIRARKAVNRLLRSS
jgi:peptidoglycan/xylan/chitin deacetylase (PgdA/CDA1 family)